MREWKARSTRSRLAVPQDVVGALKRAVHVFLLATETTVAENLL
jgi:hypothetical protein